MTVGALSKSSMLLTSARLIYRLFGPIGKGQMRKVSEVFKECEYILALERSEKLANLLTRFILS